MADEKTLKDIAVWSGHRELTLEDIAVIQPGLGRIMPEIGARTWKVFYAAKARNWPLARFQAKEIRGLMELATFTRPKYEESLNQFLAENWKPLEEAIAKEDFSTVEAACHKAVEAANAFHELRDKPYIKWKLPDTPPPDLDLTPRRKSARRRRPPRADGSMSAARRLEAAPAVHVGGALARERGRRPPRGPGRARRACGGCAHDPLLRLRAARRVGRDDGARALSFRPGAPGRRGGREPRLGADPLPAR